jgi:hypothetical protein
MSWEQARDTLLELPGVEMSTMMRTPCLRYKGEFLGMMFEQEDALIIKVSAKRVDELIDEGHGIEFDFTNKRFNEWVLIPTEFEDDYLSYLTEALEYAKQNKR